MLPKEISIDEFSRKIQSCLTIQPVRTPQQLKGRDRKLEEIERALSMPGRSVFVYGDRGVGKTSLAQTAAFIAQGQLYDPIVVGCQEGQDFGSLVGTAIKRMYATRQEIPNTELSFKIKLPFIDLSAKTKIESGEIPSFSSLNDAIDAVKFVSAHYPNPPIVIFDEFNELKDTETKKNFADFVKQISDQNVRIKIIFCGVGRSMEELLGLHASSGRSIKPVELERLDDSALWSIVEDATKIVGIRVDRETILRISLLSDGFPYFVHLVAEYMFWSVYEDEAIRDSVTVEDFGYGVLEATKHADAVLREGYDKATKKYRATIDYENIIWAFADQPTLTQQSNRVYETSYKNIVKLRNIIRERKGEKTLDPISKQVFDRRLARLKDPAHGSILRWQKAGWYGFDENMMRGYARLRAREHGIELGIDHHYASDSARALRDLREGH